MSTPQDSSTRKLAAIMFTDIKAFSWKMATNEIAAMQILKTHDAMMKESIEKHGGRVIKSIGDSFMVDFPSAVNGVLCAIELQERFWEHNKRKTDFERIEVRMGLHLGDVIDVGNDMYGDGVNIASRVEAITEPNRICITQDIYSQIKKKMTKLKVFAIGPMKFKNIDEAVEVYEILMDTIPELSAPSQTAKQAPSRKVAEKTAEREAKEAKSVEAKKQKHQGNIQEKIKVHYKNAEVYFQRGMLDEAEAELNEIEKLEIGAPAQAEKAVDKEEDEKQKKIQAHYKKAEEEFRNGELDAAEKAIQEIYRLVPIHYGAQMIMAQIEEERFRKAEERRQKIEAERRAMQKKTEQLESLNDKTRVHLDRDELTEGLQTIAETLALDPDNAEAKSFRDQIEQIQHEREERERAAAEEAQRVLQVTMEKRAEQAAKTVEQKVEVVEQPRTNKKLILQVAGGIVGLVLLFFIGSAIKSALFPNTAALAILPAEGSRADKHHFSAALAILLAEDFGRQKHVFVVSPSSAFTLINSKKSNDEIAAELNVQQLLFIKAQHDSGDVTVEATLFEVGKDTLWSGTVKAANVLQTSTVRKQVLTSVLDQLGVSQDETEFSTPTADAQAYHLYLSGLSLMQEGTAPAVQQARDSFTEALQSDSTFAMAYAARAQATVLLYKLSGETNSALLDAALDDLPNATRQEESALAHRVLGQVLRYRQRFADARQALEKSLPLQPGVAECYRELAWVALAEGNYDLASSQSAKAFTLDPKNPETAVTAGVVAHFKKDFDTALKQYNDAISLGASDSLVTIRYRLNAWAALEMRKDAEEYCKKMQQQFPDDYRTNYWVARALQQEGQWDESRPFLDKALTVAQKLREAKPDDVTLLGYTAIIKARLAKLDDAQKEIDLTFQRHGSNPEILYRRANVYAIQGQQGRANVFNALKEAVATEFNPAEILNPDFINIQKEPEYAQVIVRASSGK